MGEWLKFQGRKKRRITNAYYLTDIEWLPPAMSRHMARNRYDMDYIGIPGEELCVTLDDAGIATDGLLVN